MSGDNTAEDLAGARGRLGDQVSAMEKEFARMRADGDEVPALALEMLTRLRALATALDGLEATFEKPDTTAPPAGDEDQSP